MVTVKSIAQKLGLSSATVSRALRNDATLSIASETRMRILMTAEKMGYVKKEALNKNPTITVEKKIVVIHNQQTFRHQIDSSYYFSMRTGIEDSCNAFGFQYGFCLVENIGNFQESIDGAIIVGNYMEEQYAEICAVLKGVPLISAGIISYYPEIIDHITYSNKESVKMALDYLLLNGHKQIGYLGIKEAIGTELFGSRKQVFIDILQKRELLNTEWIYEREHGTDRMEEGYKAMDAWLSKKEPLPTAIFCANDPVALGAVKALLEHHIQVPEEISIISHDGSYPTQYSFPPITTVDVHPYQMGLESVCALKERLLSQRKITKKIILFPELIVRSSVKQLGA